MPPPPAESLFTHWILETSWVPGSVLVLCGLVFVVWLLREGRTDGLRFALGAIVAGVAIFVTGMLVKTSGERAEESVLAFVRAVGEQDIVGAVDLLAVNAHVHVGSVANAAYDRNFIVDGLDRTTRFPIERNVVTRLRGYTGDSDRATVHLGVRTESEFGPTLSEWTIDVIDEDGTWRLERFVWATMNLQPPPSSW